jgi:hypothetical protein
MPELSPVPPNLQQLTLRVEIYVENQHQDQPTLCVSYLPAAAKVINTFASSVRHLIIEIDLGVGRSPSYLALNRLFSPCSVGSRFSVDSADRSVYPHRHSSTCCHPRTLFSSLAAYEDVMKLIEDGKLVIHPEETAPDYVQYI